MTDCLNRLPAKPGRVAVLRTDRLGDLVLTTPLFRALAQAQWNVSVICPDEFLPALENNPHVAAAHGLQSLCPRWPAGWFALARHLARARYDALLIPQGKPPALLLASLFSGVSYRLALYGGKWTSLTLHARVPAALAHSEAHYSRQVLSLGGMLGASTENLRPEIFLREAELAEQREKIRQHFPAGSGPLVVIHAGGGHLRAHQRSTACNLTAEEYARLTGLLLENTPCRVVITGGSGEVAQLETAWSAWRSHPRCWFAVGGFSLRQLTALLQLSDLTIVGSTGPLHLASAVGAATLTPFCPQLGNSTITWGNQGGTGYVVERSSATCPRCHGQAWACGDFQGEITASQLFDRARAILQALPALKP